MDEWIGARWEVVLENNAELPAVYYADGTPALLFSELASLAASIAARLRDCGAAGRPVALAMRNRAEWPAAVLGIWMAGASPVLLPSHSASATNDAHFSILSLLGCAAEIFGGDGGIDVHPLPTPRVDFPWRADLWKLSSGSTGTPRAIGFSGAQIAADAEQILATMGISPADRNFGGIPFSHSYGFGNLVIPLLNFGIPLVVADESLPRALGSALELSGATVWPCVPAMIPGLLALGFKRPAKLRLALSAGAPLPVRVASEWNRRTGLPMRAFYGASECGGICFDREGLAGEIEGWVGTPLDGVRIHPVDSGEEDNVGVRSARIRVVSRAVGLGEFSLDGADVPFDGSFSPSDLLVHENGGFRIVGRACDTINVAGKKVSPLAIERELLRIDGVADAVAFGLPGGGQRGECIAAAIACSVPMGRSELRAAAARLLPTWQVPREIFVVREIPRNERGKVNRRELAALYATL